MGSHTNSETLVEQVQTKLYCPVPIKPDGMPPAACGTAEGSLPSFSSVMQIMQQLSMTSHLFPQYSGAFTMYQPYTNNSFASTVSSEPDSPVSRIACPCCPQSFTSNKGMRQHMGKVHAQDSKSTACELCSRSYKNKYALKFHQKQVHLKQTRVSCPACSKVLYNKYILNKHLRDHHSL
mmetsp:Transcript_28648/g.50957  ORF Transcript_28648/g.50957 Transcript_28648/m.50957 type:complete len:179 (-) Transcript_28648:1663-2199(-)